MIGAPSALAWVMIVGLIVTAPLTVKGGIPAASARRSSAGSPWPERERPRLAPRLRGAAVGKVSIVAPITSTEGAIAAVLAVATGEAIGVASGVMLLVIAAGVALASVAPGGGSGDQRRATLLAIERGALLRRRHLRNRASQRNAAARVGDDPGTGPRRRRNRAPTRGDTAPASHAEALPLVIVAGLCEVGGVASFAVGARDSIAISAVLASQFAALAVLAAYVLFRERITRLQLAGVAAIAIGVAVLTALQA